MWAWGINDPRQLDSLRLSEFTAMAEHARNAIAAQQQQLQQMRGGAS